MDALTEQELNHFLPTESSLRLFYERIRHQWRQWSWARRIASDSPREVAKPRGPPFGGAAPRSLASLLHGGRSRQSVMASAKSMNVMTNHHHHLEGSTKFSPQVLPWFAQ